MTSLLFELCSMYRSDFRHMSRYMYSQRDTAAEVKQVQKWQKFKNGDLDVPPFRVSVPSFENQIPQTFSDCASTLVHGEPAPRLLLQHGCRDLLDVRRQVGRRARGGVRQNGQK